MKKPDQKTKDVAMRTNSLKISFEGLIGPPSIPPMWHGHTDKIWKGPRSEALAGLADRITKAFPGDPLAPQTYHCFAPFPVNISGQTSREFADVASVLETLLEPAGLSIAGASLKENDYIFQIGARQPALVA